MIKRNTVKTFAALLCTGLLIVELASAGDTTLIIDDKNPVACKEDPSWCDIFSKNTLYDNENGSLVKKVKWVWRYHGQFHNTTLTHANGTSWSEQYWEHRRFRPGVKITFANDWQYYTEWNVGGTIGTQEGILDEDFFDNMHNMGFKGNIGGVLVDIGKHKAKLTHEWAISSNRIDTVERSIISNELIAFNGHPWGVTFGFEGLNIDHELGIWSGGSDDIENGLQDEHWWDDDTRGAISYRANRKLNDISSVHFDYMFVNNDNGRVNPAGDGGRLEVSPYNHMAAIGVYSEWGLGVCDRKASLLVEVLGGVNRIRQGGMSQFGNNDRDAGDDTAGLVILPTYDLTDRLQLVGRYSYASSARIQRPQRRAYEEDIRGGEFNDRPNLEDVHTFYLGLNYKLCGDNLKLMTGYEYLTSDLYANPNTGRDDLGSLSGNNLMIAIRTYF